MKIAFVASEDISIGAGYLIAHLKAQGHQVRLFFSPRQWDRGYAQNALLGRILSQNRHILRSIKAYKPELCLFGPVTASYQWSLIIAEAVKKEVGCKIVFGGVHATLVPEEVKKHSFIDEVVVGDGIEYFGGKFDPDKLWPDREIFLKELPPVHRKYQIFMTSIGCPFNCSYCGNEQMRKVGNFKFIKRTVEGCIEELHNLKRWHGMKYVLFVDDILTADKKWLMEFMTAYKRVIDLPFCCFAHPKFLDEDIVKSLKDGGCHSIWIGIQTGDEGLRKRILNRPETNKEIVDACAIIKKHKIKLIVDHIFGIPSESAMSNDISQNLYTIIKPDIVNCYHLLYFPKAKIIEHAISLGCITPAQVQDIEQGKGAVYQLTDKADYYNQYAKTFCAIPIGGLISEILPMWAIKLIAYLKAGRGFIPLAMIQNEVYFTLRSLWRKIT